MDEKRMTPAEAWEGLVGSQTVAEFVAIAREKGYVTVPEAVAHYVADLPSLFVDWDKSTDMDEVEQLLMAYISQRLTD